MISRINRLLPIAILAICGCVQSTSPNWYSQNIAATFFAEKWTVIDVDGATASDEEVNVALWNSDKHVPVSGGVVTMNSTVIPFSSSSNDSNGFSYQLDHAAGESVPFSFNGGPLVFSLAGSSEFPALTDSITFPNQDMNVTSPAGGAVISKSSGFIVNWNHVQNSTDSIMVTITEDSVTTGVQYTTTDNGAITVPAAALSVFKPGGRMNITVSRFINKNGTYMDRQYKMESWSESIIYHMMIP